MQRCQAATLYIGNLDERVDERLLYEIMIQAGPLVEIHMPRDRETRRHKAYAFAEYTTKESAAYALGLFSGLVSLYNRSVKFAMSGEEKQVNSSQHAKSSLGHVGNGPSLDSLVRESSPGDTWSFNPQQQQAVVYRSPLGYREVGDHSYPGLNISGTYYQ